MTIGEIYLKLGLDETNGLCFADNSRAAGKKIDRVFHALDPKPDSIFCLEEKPFILFYDNPTNRDGLFKAIWNLNETPVVIVVENSAVNIFNGFEYIKDNFALSLIGNDERLDDFTYFKLVTGETWEKYNELLTYKNRVDYKLLENIKDARSILINSHNLSNHTANALLGKIIFTRYLIDRQVRIGFGGELKEWTSADFCSVLANREDAFTFFQYLEDKFGGNLFDFDDSSDMISKEALSILIDLLNGVKLNTGQLSLFDIFDFSIIPVEFISNVYELFIGQQEQATTGSYYTPLFLVEYITSQTVQQYFKSNTNEYNCRILDPACGSGIFLVEGLRLIIERFNVLTPNLLRTSIEYQNQLKSLAEDNIFGIDKDGSAISVAIFSVYLTLLDYQNPRDIENFVFPQLLNTNFFISDFFDLEKPFNDKLAKVTFNYIIGNPPWKRGATQKGIKEPYEQYISFRKKKEVKKTVKIAISNKEIAQAFLLRVSDFSKEITNSALIVTSKTLYNLKALNFRRYFLNDFFISNVFELSPVRREVFNKSNDPAIAPAVILFYKYAFEKSTDDSLIEHISVKPSRFFSLFNLFMVNRNDIKTVKQKLLKDHDWLWKTLLYGHYLDFSFLLRLSSYQKISERLIEKGYLNGVGFQMGEDENPVGILGTLQLLEPKYVKPFRAHKKLIPFTEQTLHRVRDEGLYFGKRLLIKKGLSNKLKSVAAFIDYDCLFKDSITAIKIENEDGLDDLRTISGSLQSDLFSYYALTRFSSIGVEREQGFNEERFTFPFIENVFLSKVVAQIERSLIPESEDSLIWNSVSDRQMELLNESIYRSFCLTSPEKSLIDYANKYVIPTIIQKVDISSFPAIKFEDDSLDEYSKIFVEKFSSVFKGAKSFSIDIWHSNHIIGMFFRISEMATEKQPINWIKKDNDFVLKTIISLGHERLTDKLFIQKDVRGFEKDFFYIFKPNEKRLWHPALAYLDLNVFLDAILKTGKE